MKTCPELECLIDFSSHLPEDRDAELAAHIFCCEHCQQLLTEIVLEPETPDNAVSPQELRELRSFIQKNIVPVRNDLWDRLLKKVTDVLDGGYGISRMPFFPGHAPLPALSSGRISSAVGKTSSFIPVVFAATVPKDDPAYWQATLEIPPQATLSSMLNIKIVNGVGSPICSGKFYMLGIELEINNGIAQISLYDFQKGLRCPVASYTDPNGKIIIGDLIIC